VLVVLRGDTAAEPGEASEAAASLKKARSEEHIDQGLDVIKWAVAPVPDDPNDALLRNSRRRVSPDRRQRFREPAQPHCGEPTVDLGGHKPSPSR
jgi:hypothetical protein